MMRSVLTALAVLAAASATVEVSFPNVGFMRTPLPGRGLAVRPPYAYLVLGNAGEAESTLAVVNVTDENNPVQLSTTVLQGSCEAVWAGGVVSRVQARVEWVYVACGSVGLVMLDVSDPRAPRVVDTLAPMDGGMWSRVEGVPGNASDATVERLWVSDSIHGVAVVAAEVNRALPSLALTKNIAVDGGAVGISVDEDSGTVYTSSPALGIVAIDPVLHMVSARSRAEARNVTGVAARGGIICMSSLDVGVEVFRAVQVQQGVYISPMGIHSHPAVDIAVPHVIPSHSPERPVNKDHLWAYVVYDQGDAFGVLDVSQDAPALVGLSDHVPALSGVDPRAIAVWGDFAFAVYHVGFGVFTISDDDGSAPINQNLVVLIVVGSMALCGGLLYSMCNTVCWENWLSGGAYLDEEGRRVAAGSESDTLTQSGSARVKRRRARRALWSALMFCIFFMVTEAVGGWFANSIAVLSDAAHMATDVAALGLSLYALHASGKPRSMKYTYGWHRVEIVGALISLMTIWFLTGIIVYEATKRLGSKEEVDGRLMLMLGSAGLFVNILVAYILAKGNAEVMHTHSHGASGACPSTGGHGHSHAKPKQYFGAHSHSHGEKTGFAGTGADAADYGTANGHSHRGCTEAGHGHSHGNGDPSHEDARSAEVALMQGTTSGTEDASPELHSESSRARKEAGSSVFSVKKGENVNVKSAMVHAIGDCVQSIGVILAAGIIWAGNVHLTGEPKAYGTPYNLADPITSFVFAAVTLVTTVGMFKQVIGVLLESSCGLPFEEITLDFEAAFGAANVHDLHLWSITLGKPALSVHIISDDHVGALYKAKSICSHHDIEHTTIQVDPLDDGHCNCASMICPDHSEGIASPLVK